MSRGENVMAYETQTALEQIDRDIRMSGQFLAGNDFTLASPQGYSGSAGTRYTSFENTGSNGPMLLLRAVATDSNPLSPSRSAIYTDQPTNSCTNAFAYNQPFVYNIAYFVRDNALWRRTLVPQGSSVPTLCSYNGSTWVSAAAPGATWQLPSCSPGTVSTTTCKAEDMKLVNNVSTLNIEYFQTASSPSPISEVGDATTPFDERAALLEDSTTARLTIETTNTVAGRPIHYSSSLRSSKLYSLELPTSLAQ